MKAPLRQANRLGRLTTELGTDILALLRFDGTDHLNELFEYCVEALRTTGYEDYWLSLVSSLSLESEQL